MIVLMVSILAIWWLVVAALAAVAVFITLKYPCWLGVHRWDQPGGHCEDCGKRDDFFD